jgi:hypothetical protein
MKSVPELFLHDVPETTARSPRIDQSMQKQRTLDQAATTARSRLNDRTIQAQRTLDFMETGAHCYSLESKSLKYLI